MEALTVTVLVADDDPRVIEALSVVLSRDPGIEVVSVVSDGEAAVSLAETVRPNVAVVDWGMPGGGGAGIRQLRVASPTTAVVVYSAHSDALAKAEAAAAGAGWFLVKGADEADLLTTIETAARSSRQD